MATEIVTSENRAQYMQQKMSQRGSFSESDHPRDANGKFTDKGGRAQAGGEVAKSNGYFYKGGQFLPTTDAEPGKWKIGKKWINSGQELVEPGKKAIQPTPFSRSIFSMLNAYVEQGKDGKLSLKEGLKFGDGSKVSLDSEYTPGVKGVMNKEPITVKELIDGYNNGQRWFDVNPDAATLTTKK